MDRKRLWRTIRLNLYLKKGKKAKYIRRKKIFANFGKGSGYALRTIPLYPELISIGNYVRIAPKVTFVTHDVVNAIWNSDPNFPGHGSYREYMGCIQIDDNVFVGVGVTIMANVHIGSNVVIGADSLVTKDLPGGYVYAGVPAKPICTIEEFAAKREAGIRYPEGFTRSGDSIGPDFAKWLWDDFRRQRNEKQADPDNKDHENK